MKKSVIVLWHFAYWFMYALIVLLVWAGGQNHSNPPHLEGMAAIKAVINVLFLSPFSFLSFWSGVLGFYSFYFILFDKFLAKKKVVKLVISAVLISILVPIILETILLIIFKLKFHFPLIGPGIGMAVVAFVNGILGLVIKGFISWYEDIKVKAELEKDKLTNQLELLKSKINPHFLFNTINNIDMLIQKDANKASEYLNKLSDIMRFMLYETREEKIPLTKELSYIEKYIELQKIRTTNSNYVKYEVKGKAENLLIEPMLFIPFIENAFKHAENKKIENAITICFVIEKDKIKFKCENVYTTGTPLKDEHSGLGNELIERRLILLYPNKHTFEVVNKNGIYKVNLSLSL